MPAAPAKALTLDLLKDRFLENAIRTDARAFALRESVIANDAKREAAAARRRTKKTRPAESWA